MKQSNKREYIYDGFRISIGDRVICHGDINNFFATDGKTGIVKAVEDAEPGDNIMGDQILVQFDADDSLWACDVWLELPDRLAGDPLDEIEI